MPQWFILLVVAFGLWWFFLFRMARFRRETRSRLLYWTGGFMSDPGPPMVVKLILIVINVGVLYGIILAAYYLQGKL